MTELIPAFPYVGKVVYDYLKANVPSSWVVATKVPADKPDHLITITTLPTRGVSNMVLSTRMIVIHCWNSDELYCARMAERVRALLVSAPRNGVQWIRGVTVVGEPADFRDPDDLGSPRFQLTVNVLLRGFTDAHPDPLTVGS